MTVNARFTEIGADSLARMELTAQNVAGDRDTKLLFDELLAIRSKPGSMYSTYVDGDDGEDGLEFVIQTTNREIHEGLGRISKLGRLILCKTIVDELDGIQRVGLIFLSPMEGEHKTRPAMLIVRSQTEGDGRIFLTLSPAR